MPEAVYRQLLRLFGAFALAMVAPIPAGAEAISVQLQQTEAGWELLRDGEPYFIRGAGGDHSLAELAAAGGNSIRTWDGEGIGPLLDEAHQLGLTVAVGIWLQHERHGFDYSDAAAVAKQKQRAREIVLRYRDHPAVLLWGVGNEVEEFAAGDDPRIWNAINDIAAMIKELDPHHPTMAVTAELGGERIKSVHETMTAIDIHGVNAYGGSASVAQRLAEGGATKPFIITEFGPIGFWERPTTDWGAPLEQTSTEKAEFFRKTYEQSILAAPGRALGSYAFVWGYKMEATETWFGMILKDGSQLGSVDVMSELWTGKPRANLAPAVAGLQIDGSTEVQPGVTLQVRAMVSDPEGDQLRARWALRREASEYAAGGDFRPDVPDIDGAVLQDTAHEAQVKMPQEPGAYRVFYYVYDAKGTAATANLPLYIKGEPQASRPSQVAAQFPFVVYEDSFENMPWVPSGWMGNVDAIELDGQFTDSPADGTAAIRFRYEGKYDWAGVAWQHPANNWGEQEGGLNLTGATALEFWARGEYGGEKISVSVGLLGQDKPHPDSSITKLSDVALTSEWQRYEVKLRNADLSSLKTAFSVVVAGGSSPVTIYLDDIRFID